MKNFQLHQVMVSALLVCSMSHSLAQGLPQYAPPAIGPIQDWAKSNQTVYDIGGWRAYLKQSQAHMQQLQAQPNAATGMTQDQALDAYLQVHKLSKRDVQNPELHEATFTLKQAWIRTVAMQQKVQLLQLVHENNQLVLELSARMVAVGNRASLSHASVQLAYARSSQELALVQHDLRQKQLQFQTLLRLKTPVVLPSVLPELPSKALTQSNFSSVEIGRLLIYDTLHTYTLAYQLAHHAKHQIVPLHSTIVDETVLRYNGMLLSTFDILREHQALIQARIEALAAAEQFFLVEAVMQLALAGMPSPYALSQQSSAPSGAAAKH